MQCKEKKRKKKHRTKFNYVFLISFIFACATSIKSYETQDDQNQKSNRTQVHIVDSSIPMRQNSKKFTSSQIFNLFFQHELWNIFATNWYRDNSFSCMYVITESVVICFGFVQSFIWIDFMKLESWYNLLCDLWNTNPSVFLDNKTRLDWEMALSFCFHCFYSRIPNLDCLWTWHFSRR